MITNAVKFHLICTPVKCPGGGPRACGGGLEATADSQGRGGGRGAGGGYNLGGPRQGSGV